MSDSQKPKCDCTKLFTFLGGLGAILIFALILFVAYLPNRPAPVDTERNAARQAKADEIRGQGVAKMGDIEAAMDAIVSAYQKD